MRPPPRSTRSSRALAAKAVAAGYSNSTIINDYNQAIVDWFEIPGNYARLMNPDGSLRNDADHESRKDVFKEIVRHLRSQGITTSIQHVNRKMYHWFKRYREARHLATGTHYNRDAVIRTFPYYYEIEASSHSRTWAGGAPEAAASQQQSISADGSIVPEPTQQQQQRQLDLSPLRSCSAPGEISRRRRISPSTAIPHSSSPSPSYADNTATAAREEGITERQHTEMEQMQAVVEQLQQPQQPRIDQEQEQQDQMGDEQPEQSEQRQIGYAQPDHLETEQPQQPSASDSASCALSDQHHQSQQSEVNAVPRSLPPATASRSPSLPSSCSMQTQQHNSCTRATRYLRMCHKLQRQIARQRSSIYRAQEMEAKTSLVDALKEAGFNKGEIWMVIRQHCDERA